MRDSLVDFWGRGGLAMQMDRWGFIFFSWRTTRTIAAMSVVVARSQIDAVLAVATDGQSALESLAAHASDGTRLPDLILLDVSLPGISGIDALRQTKDAPAFAEPPVILLTGSDDEEHIWAGQLLGAHSELEKPLTVDQFIWIAKAVTSYRERLNLLTQLRNRSSA